MIFALAFWVAPVKAQRNAAARDVLACREGCSCSRFRHQMKPCFVLCPFRGHWRKGSWRLNRGIPRPARAAAPAPPSAYPPCLPMFMFTSTKVNLVFHANALLSPSTPSAPPLAPVPAFHFSRLLAPSRLSSRIGIAVPPSPAPPPPRPARVYLPTRSIIVAQPVHLLGGKLGRGHMERNPLPLLIYLTSRPPSLGSGVSLLWPSQLILIFSSSTLTSLSIEETRSQQTVSNRCSLLYT